MADPSSTTTQNDALGSSHFMMLLSDPAPDDKPRFIDTLVGVSRLLQSLRDLPVQPPTLFVDLEGIRLSRYGSISILQLYVSTTQQTYLIDVHTLGERAFVVQGPDGQTLKQMLESEDIPKVFFDVRNDSDALNSHFGIKLAGVQDLQLMELATRPSGRRLVNGLGKCIERDAQLSGRERGEWSQGKEKGLRLFAPERGGSYAVFNERPLPEDIARYCAQDVYLLPRLWKHYDSRLTPAWRERVKGASAERVVESQSAGYVPNGRHKALAPNGWDRL